MAPLGPEPIGKHAYWLVLPIPQLRRRIHFLSSRSMSRLFPRARGLSPFCWIHPCLAATWLARVPRLPAGWFSSSLIYQPCRGACVSAKVFTGCPSGISRCRSIARNSSPVTRASSEASWCALARRNNQKPCCVQRWGSCRRIPRCRWPAPAWLGHLRRQLRNRG